MSAALSLALLSMVFAGANDVAFKRYATKERSRGTYVFGIGLVWAVLQVALLAGNGGRLDLSGPTLGYGIVAGLLLTVSNLSLIESLRHIDAGLGSTVYRLNTIGVVVLSVLLLGEPLGAAKVTGVALGVLAVLLLYRPGAHGSADAGTFTAFFGLAVFASLCRSVYGVVSKDGLAQGAALDTMLVIAALCWIVGGAGYALVREGRFRMTGKKAAYSLVSGTLVFLIVNFLLLAIERGEASIVIPVANMSFVIALLLSVGFGMEGLTSRKLAAVAVSIGAIAALSLA